MDLLLFESPYLNTSEHGYSMPKREQCDPKHDNEYDGFNESSGTTKLKFGSFTHVWEIKNFKYFCSLNTGECVGSRPFVTTLVSKGTLVTWKLKVYPNGLDEQTRCKVVALLKCFACSSSEALKVEFSFHIHEADHSIRRSSQVRRWVALKPNTHGFCVIGDPHEILQDQVDDTLIISCTARVVDVFITVSNLKTEKKFGTVVPFKHTWKIKKNVFGCLTTGEHLPSSSFFTLRGDRDEVEWRLLIFPNGLDEESKHQVSIYLCCVSCSSPEPIIVQFWICLLDEQGDISYGKNIDCVTFTANSKVGFADFAKNTEFLKYKDEEDIIVILCKGEIRKKIASS